MCSLVLKGAPLTLAPRAIHPQLSMSSDSPYFMDLFWRSRDQNPGASCEYTVLRMAQHLRRPEGWGGAAWLSGEHAYSMTLRA